MPAESATSSRARRMLALLPELRPGIGLSVSRLANAVGATPAQIASDLAALSMCGLPPFSPYELIDVFVDGDSVEVYSDPPSLTAPVRLTAEEAAALASALGVCGHSPDDPLTSKLLAASAIDPEALAATVRTAATDSEGTLHSTIASALAQHRVLRIAYQGSGRDAAEERIVEPWSLANERGVWYLSAWCRSAGAERTFRLDRMASAEPTGEASRPPDHARSPVAAFTRASDLPKATVRFDAGSEGLEERDWPGATFREEPDGSVLAEIPFASSGWIARRIAARLGRAEVLAPLELRRSVAETARALLEA